VELGIVGMRTEDEEAKGHGRWLLGEGGKVRNPKSEARNPKQVQNPKDE
jgi:hypothetical protein